MDEESLLRHIRESVMSDQEKDDLVGFIQGKKLPQLTGDTVAKHIFSPDIHKERYDFLLQRVMKDPSINVRSSAANEMLLTNINSKKIITDLPGWLQDGRLSDIEMQVIAQSFIDIRVDIYSSSMLMVQYSAEAGQKRSEINYDNVNDVVLVVLMRKSPEFFQNYESKRYIHRITDVTTDSGMKLQTARKIAYVQLDKALELFCNKQYETDEYEELLLWLAALADINNPIVSEAVKNNRELNELQKEVMEFSQSKEVRLMITADQLAMMDYNTAIHEAEARGEARGETRGALLQSIRMYKNCIASGMTEEKARSLSELPADYKVD